MAPLRSQSKQPSVPAFDAGAIREHVALLHRLAEGQDGILVATVFYANPDGDRDATGIVTHHRIGDVAGMVDSIMAHDGVANANVYAIPSVMRRDLPRGKKGSEADVVAVLALVADQDDDTGMTGEMPVDVSYSIESSPGNFQKWVIFDKPLSPADAKPLAQAFKHATGSDHCTADISHTWRVPGCLNWPNKKKLGRGRSPEPTPVTIAEQWSGVFITGEELAAALKPWAQSTVEFVSVSIGDLPDASGLDVTAEAAVLLAADDVGDRSSHAARVVERLAFDGHTAETAAALFLASTGNWATRYRDQGHMRADFERLWGKPIAQQHVEIREAGARLSAGVVANAKAPPTPANDNKPRGPDLVHSGDFVRGFVPPDYAVDGIVQAGFLYSLTGQTGSGKTAVALLLAACTALGVAFAGRETRKGRVFYFAGENPDDVTMRWIGLCHTLGLDADKLDVYFVRGVFSVAEFLDHIAGKAHELGGVDLIIVDTAAAFFTGVDENNNVEMGNYARQLRELAKLTWRPAVIAASHPVKNAGADNLLPRGGGAFLNEVDGNLTLAKRGEMSVMHWQGKHRGPDFQALTFDLKTINAPALVDSKGRPIPTVMATPVGDAEIAMRADMDNRDDEKMLLAIRQKGARSLKEFAEEFGWLDVKGDVDKRRAQTSTDRLKRAQLVTCELRTWKLTKRGEEATVIAAADRHKRETWSKAAGAVVQSARRKRRRRTADRTEPAETHDND